MEIERKFLIKNLPIDINSYPHYDIEQGYILTNPVLRVRKANDKYVFTYKSKGMLSHEEINVPIEREAYDKLLKKNWRKINNENQIQDSFKRYFIWRWS